LGPAAHDSYIPMERAIGNHFALHVKNNAYS